MKQRIEKDSLGLVKVPHRALYGAQTVRSFTNFKIGSDQFSYEFVRALAIVKKAAALAHRDLKCLPLSKVRLIVRVCDEIINGKHLDQFPLSIWQTGSATQTNMNMNEVIANRAIQIVGGKLGSKHPIHPNDDVNKGQSSNDVIPTAMHLSAVSLTLNNLLPAVKQLRKTLQQKSVEFNTDIKIARTHLMDATPITLGQEFSGYAYQIKQRIESIEFCLRHLKELALGATAVGTGLNTHPRFKAVAIKHISSLTGIAFVPTGNLFSAIACHDALVAFGGALKTLAVSLTKIANDIRWMGSGPRCGLAELVLPENEPGSSMMPGKVNPTQCEALLMVCAQVMGFDATLCIAGASGNFELNTYKPVIIHDILLSIRLLSDGCASFREHCVVGLKVNKETTQRNLNNSLMLITALNPELGYDRSAQIAQKAFREQKSLKQSAQELGFLTPEKFDNIVCPEKMIKPQRTRK